MVGKLAAAAILLAMSAPGLSRVSGFVLLNQTGVPISGIALRRTGSAEWRPVAGGASDGARAKIGFSDSGADCAFDLRAMLARHGETVWHGVNLCEVSTVTLHRDASGTTWVDYD